MLCCPSPALSAAPSARLPPSPCSPDPDRLTFDQFDVSLLLVGGAPLPQLPERPRLLLVLAAERAQLELQRGRLFLQLHMSVGLEPGVRLQRGLPLGQPVGLGLRSRPPAWQRQRPEWCQCYCLPTAPELSNLRTERCTVDCAAVENTLKSLQ